MIELQCLLGFAQIKTTTFGTNLNEQVTKELYAYILNT